MQESQVTLGNFTSLPSKVVSSLPHGNLPFLSADLSRGVKTLNSSSSVPVLILNVQLPLGDGWRIFQAKKFLDPGVERKWTPVFSVPAHGPLARLVVL